jgi:hypothetical protein
MTIAGGYIAHLSIPAEIRGLLPNPQGQRDGNTRVLPLSRKAALVFDHQAYLLNETFSSTTKKPQGIWLLVFRRGEETVLRRPDV